MPYQNKKQTKELTDTENFDGCQIGMGRGRGDQEVQTGSYKIFMGVYSIG